ncbi:MAG: helix-turn-helix domain-containing protein [Polyangiales bacterium]
MHPDLSFPPSPPGPRHCVIVALPDAFSLDVFGPLEVFTMAARLWNQRHEWDSDLRALPSDAGVVPELLYRVEVVGVEAGAVGTTSGFTLPASRALSDVREPIDTLLIAGGDRGVIAALSQPALLAEVKRVGALARRVGSVCTGSFVLAAAGLLDGRRATSHWASCDALAQMFPAVQVERHPVYTRDGRVYTSAGATAGMDLALALVREDHGAKLALEVARWLVLFLHRAGDQPQLSAQLSAQRAERDPFFELRSYVADHLTADLRVPALAARVGMSPRNFARAFAQETGVTPGAFVEQVRLEAARRMLEESSATLAQIAAAAGFGAAETLRRVFTRATGVAPSAHRARIRATQGIRMGLGVP